MPPWPEDNCDITVQTLEHSISCTADRGCTQDDTAAQDALLFTI